MPALKLIKAKMDRGMPGTVTPEEIRFMLDHVAAMTAALAKSVEIIRLWHSMGDKSVFEPDTWDIYWRLSPEIKTIREALKAVHEVES